MKTKEQVIEELNAMSTEDSDPEMAHADADRLLLQFLRDNGHPEIAEAFNGARDRIGFWYA